MLCVYGIVPAAQTEPKVQGVHRAPVRLVPHDDLAAIVSDLDGELLARRRDVEAHLSVLEQAFSAGPVLPFRFGTVVADEPALQATLAGSADRYRALLDELAGLVQMTLKAVRSDEETVRVVVGSSDRLRRLVRRLAGSAAVGDQLQLGESVASAVELLSERDAHDISSRLSPLARAAAAEQATPPTVVSLALLLHPDQLSRLDQEVAALHDDYGTRMTFDYAGPMPPYSFVG